MCTFVLKADGRRLTGSISQGPAAAATSVATTLIQAIEITDGALDGERISFKGSAAGNTIAFSGIVHGDTISFTRKLLNGSSGLNGIYGARG
jgi:hypothetical protein